MHTVVAGTKPLSSVEETGGLVSRPLAACLVLESLKSDKSKPEDEGYRGL